MKKLFLLIAICFALTFQSTFAQNVAINKDGSTPSASALLDVSATDAGILIPRMTETQKNAITSPATGLLIFQTNNVPGFRFYNGTAWLPMASRNTETISFLKDRTEPYIKFENTSYQDVSSFLYRGTAEMGAITSVKSISYSEGSDSYSIRLYDVTNSQTIAELTGITGTTTEINDLGTISNLPTSEAIFVIQGKKDSGDKGRIQSISIQY